MEYYSSHINRLIEQLSHLPGIGAKSAQRLAFHIMNMPKEQVQQLTSSIVNARENVQYCKCCYTLTDKEMCPICSNPKRDHSTIMVVENTRDLAAYEKTGKFEGVYHVLHGAISPMLGIGPDDIKLKELMQRLAGEEVKEVIIATNSSLEGETTAMYISKLIKPTVSQSRANCLSKDGCPCPGSYPSAGQNLELSGVSISSPITILPSSSRPNSNLVSAMMIPLLSAYSAHFL